MASKRFMLTLKERGVRVRTHLFVTGPGEQSGADSVQNNIKKSLPVLSVPIYR